MTVTIGDAVHHIKEDEYLRIYPGDIPPPEKGDPLHYVRRQSAGAQRLPDTLMCPAGRP